MNWLASPIVPLLTLWLVMFLALLALDRGVEIVTRAVAGRRNRRRRAKQLADEARAAIEQILTAYLAAQSTLRSIASHPMNCQCANCAERTANH